MTWLIVCDCAGAPAELIGIVAIDDQGGAHVAEPSLTGKGRGSGGTVIKMTRRGDRVGFPLTVRFFHELCGKSLMVNERELGELFAAIATAVEDQRISLSGLCAVNGKLQRGGTR